MITLDQQKLVDDWVSDCSTDFEEGAFTDMALKANIFGLSGNTCNLAKSIQEYIDKLVADGVLRQCSGCCGTLYWRGNSHE